MYTVYVIKNPKGVLYKGYTVHLNKRFALHNANDGFSSYTSKRGPWELVYSEKYRTKNEAKERERYFKSGQGRKYLKEILGDYPPEADG
jgi:putative endonuclease